ncbi:unnamed protein product [Chondrus crispus]|uniref:BZIP domain-containing protein n=1 Tax=Chondrus crispus TaxID=2769 RepID=R7QLX4_CHOCR|nr:unnamed protein product [Chondrus crispus]CDF39099.1 unnamed protein product [Chondrus crispus]|eukprot:XP_005719010.1 unnamed protein product [Chondrus crispus]
MSTTHLRMPPHLQRTAPLATLVVDADAPSWAVCRTGLTLDRGTIPAMFNSRSDRTIFRLPESNRAVRDWLYSRPFVEALGNDAFENAAIESSTIFRMHPIDPHDPSIKISPTVSSHWLMVPFQSINGVTIGLVYLDVLYERPEEELRVPPLPVGKFAIEDATGEVFVTAWGDDIMIIGWIQSIIKCERVRELLMFRPPPHDAQPPTELLRRNSFYERRACHLCGHGDHISGLPEPCTGVGPVARPAPFLGGPMPLTNIATLYRRFRGAYFGVCIKTSYANNRMTDQVRVPVFCDVRKSLSPVRERFKINLRKNVQFSFDSPLTNTLFGLSPRSSSRLFILNSNKPVSSSLAIMDSSKRKRRRRDNCSTADRMDVCSPMSIVGDHDGSIASSEHSESPSSRPSHTRRRAGIDDMDRGTTAFQRKQRNRQAAEKSNQKRKERLEKQKRELEDLKMKRQKLMWRQKELQDENANLKALVSAPSIEDAMQNPFMDVMDDGWNALDQPEEWL